MFTGIVQAVGRIHSLQQNSFGAKLAVDSQGWLQRHEPGDSIAVAGCCLTLLEQRQQFLMFDVIAQTLQRTTLGEREVGDRVNLESALKPQTPIGGHFVQGHIDAIGTVVSVVQTENEARLRLAVGREALPYLTPTGGVAIDGVSLTIAEVDDEASAMEVALIPTTLEQTTLSEVQEGNRLNIETDILARTVVHNMRLNNQFSSDA